MATKKEMNQLLGFFVLEILIGANAGIAFAVIESRYVAAIWAGTWFTLLGILLIYWSVRRRRKFMLGLALIHTLVMSLPILITRILAKNDLPLETVLGVPAPIVHKAATTTFWILVAYTLFEAIKAFREQVNAVGRLQ